jgi:hypothetical protein
MPALAERLNRVSISASVIMTIKARELAAQGIKVVSLASGEPDFPTPPHAIEAAHQAALAGDTKYPPQDGTKRLKEAVQRNATITLTTRLMRSWSPMAASRASSTPSWRRLIRVMRC